MTAVLALVAAGLLLVGAGVLLIVFAFDVKGETTWHF